jgi:hypothetical protein
MPLLITFLVPFGILGAFLARPGVRRALAILRVQNRGADAAATVLEVVPTGVMINRVPQWQLRYEFRDRQGRVHTGTSDSLTPHEAADWRPSDRGVIRFDPARPQDSLWLGKRSA